MSEENTAVTEEVEEAVDQAVDPVEPGEERRPWAVMRDGDILERVKNGFRLESEAIDWIKTHIVEEETLVAMRYGHAFRAEIVRKVTEV